MSQLLVSVPGSAKPDFSKQTPRSVDSEGLRRHRPTDNATDTASGRSEGGTRPAPEKASLDTRCKPIELRIIRDGKIYRSKAEEERLVMLGQWHHRRQRRRNRFRR